MKAIIQQRLADAVSMKIPKLIKREFRFPQIPNKTYAVIGMRRAGKTYFLFQMMKERLENGIDRTKLVYFNFEDERLADMTPRDLHWISDAYYTMFPENRSGKVYFFFDEIQLVEGWEQYVRRLMDTENVSIFISGSSAKMLSREIATSMRGRSIEVIISPYSFREFLKRQNTAIPSSLLNISKAERSLLENRFLDYLAGGGFPEAVGLSSPDRCVLLQGYVNTVLFRDVVDRYNISNIHVLKTLIRHLIQNPGSKFTVNKFYNQLKSQGFRVAKGTLHEYLDYLRDAFLVDTIHLYTKSERKRMINPIKPYIVDTGLAESFSIKHEPETGHLLENCIFAELRRRHGDVTYMKTSSGYEIDFFVTYAHGVRQAIQVAADISNPRTRERECRALSEAGAAFPSISLLLINISEEETVERNGSSIRIIPAWKWLIASQGEYM